MKICFNYNQCSYNENTVLTVGTFDGVHAGHRRIIETMQERASALASRSCLVTFNPHPQQVLSKSGKKNIRILTSLEEKAQILEDIGIDILLVIPFTVEFANISAEEFVHTILIQNIGIKEIVVGHDHAFGKDREGSIDNLKSFGEHWGFGVTVVPPLLDNGVPVSSTRIRKLIQERRLEEAHNFLGRPFSFTGTVVRGDGRGRSLNYPTANIVLKHPEKIMVPDGIYVCEVDLNGTPFKAMMSIGFRPTFNAQKHTVEVHILDFDQNLYGEAITVCVLHFIRDELKFENELELIKRMDLDKIETLEFFKNKTELM
jgi:riboflavin kinase/FMN adenylyltransferase